MSGVPRDQLLEAADEIERLQHIEGEFHNIDDVAEIRRLREALQSIVDANPRKTVSSPNGSQDQYISGMYAQWLIDKQLSQSVLEPPSILRLNHRLRGRAAMMDTDEIARLEWEAEMQRQVDEQGRWPRWIAYPLILLAAVTSWVGILWVWQG